MKLWHKLLILWLAAALLKLLWGAVIILKGGSFETAKSATAPMYIVVLVLIYISVFAMAKDKGWLEYEYRHDERTKKLSGVAFRYSWLAMMMLIAALILIRTYYPEKLDVDKVLSIMGAAVLVIPFVLLWYFNRKGDVE